jgi:tetratricopeptide (TPR) repeat protein
LEQRKQDLKDSLIALYHMREEKITYSAVETLYYIAAENFVPVGVVESVFQQSKSQIPKDTSPMAFLIISNASHIADAHHSQKEYRENIDRLDRLAIDSWLDKGIRAYALGDYEEAIKCYDKALEIDPSSARALYLKDLALRRLGRSDAQNF